MTKIHIDSDLDQITIEGIRYSLSVFRKLGLGPIGSSFKIIGRDKDGVLTLQRIEPPYTTLRLPQSHETYMGSRAMADVVRERQRQIHGEGFVQDHDDRYRCDELATAAACYALPPDLIGTLTRTESNGDIFERIPRLWPWHARWWKPSDRRRNLIKAAALILAEIERLDRAIDKTSRQSCNQCGFDLCDHDPAELARCRS